MEEDSINKEEQRSSTNSESNSDLHQLSKPLLQNEQKDVNDGPLSKYEICPLQRNMSDSRLMPDKYDGITPKQKWAYGVGHFLNDLIAAMWFNFLSLYLKEINPISLSRPGFYAGIVLFCGQIVDAISTPSVGLLSDKTNTIIGKRKPWYILGSILTSISFFFIFEKCYISESFTNLHVAYAIFFPSLMNVGWACVQVSHMSLVPSLSCSRHMRDKLNGLRNTFTYLANFTVLGVALIVFATVKKPMNKFTILSISIEAFGIIFTLIFLFFVNEVSLSKITLQCQFRIQKYLDYRHEQDKNILQLKQNTDENQNQVQDNMVIKEEMDQHQLLLQNKQESIVLIEKNHEEEEIKNIVENNYNDNISENEEREKIHWYSWFKFKDFYLYGILYMCVRVVNNCTMTFIMFYLLYVVKFAACSCQIDLPIELALIPLVMYTCSVGSSYMQVRMFKKIGRKWSFSIGTLVIMGSSVTMIFLEENSKFVMYFVAALSGIGQAIALNTGISMISEVIGQKEQGSAFVFGAYSLLDKLSNGIILLLVLSNQGFESNKEGFIRWVTVLIPGIAQIVAWCVVMLGNAPDYKIDKGITIKTVSQKETDSIAKLLDNYVVYSIHNDKRGEQLQLQQENHQGNLKQQKGQIE